MKRSIFLIGLMLLAVAFGQTSYDAGFPTDDEISDLISAKNWVLNEQCALGDSATLGTARYVLLKIPTSKRIYMSADLISSAAAASMVFTVYEGFKPNTNNGGSIQAYFMSNTLPYSLGWNNNGRTKGTYYNLGGNTNVAATDPIVAWTATSNFGMTAAGTAMYADQMLGFNTFKVKIPAMELVGGKYYLIVLTNNVAAITNTYNYNLYFRTK